MAREKEYLDFLRKNDFVISTEDLFNLDHLDTTVLNDQNWSELGEFYHNNSYVIIDNFLKTDFALRLKNFVLYTNIRCDFYDDYESINFRREKNHYWFPLLTNLITELKKNFQHLQDLDFVRAWSFIYNNISNGTSIHADPAKINFNLWVTEENCLVKKNDHNGMEIWKTIPPDEYWTSFKKYLNYKGNSDIAHKYFKLNSLEPIKINYQFNRMIIFNSQFFHRSQPIASNPGFENSRINYTFLFE
jgi:hypothetical protein